MSRVGIMPITIPSGVSVDIDKDKVNVKGPKGELHVDILDQVKVAKDGESVVITRTNDEPEARAQHGLIRTLISNAVVGVSEGFSKVLEVEGVGFKVSLSGNKLVLNLGYSHPHEVILPDGVEAQVEGNVITISGYNKQLIGQIAADIRALRPPEPYKGKGIHYQGEYIIRKAGKAAGVAK